MRRLCVEHLARRCYVWTVTDKFYIDWGMAMTGLYVSDRPRPQDAIDPIRLLAPN
jgi:hypothetical protein